MDPPRRARRAPRRRRRHCVGKRRDGCLDPTATATQALVAGSPSAIACGGSVDAQITVTGHAGTTGNVTDVLLVLDLSGSTGTPAYKLDNLKSAAGRDGSTPLGATGGRQPRRHRVLPGLVGDDQRGGGFSQTPDRAIAALPAPEGASPHEPASTRRPRCSAR